MPKNNTINGEAWFQEAEALQDAGTYTEAIHAYEKALDYGALQRPFESAYRIAQCYAHLQNRDSAWEWLKQAVELGFDKLMTLQSDEAFAPFHDNEDFRELVGLPQQAPLSRDEGLRRNVDVLVREVRRIGYAPFHTTPEDTFALRADALKNYLDGMTDLEYTAEFMALLQLCGDGHTKLFWGGDEDYFNQALPFEFYLFEEGLYIIAAASEFVQWVGKRVDKVDDCDIETAISRLAPYMSRDNDIWLKHLVPFYLRAVPLLYVAGITQHDDRAMLTIEGEQVEFSTQDGKIIVSFYDPHTDWVWLYEQLAGELPPYLKHRHKFHYVNYMEGETLLYAGFNQTRDMPDETVADFTTQIVTILKEKTVSKFVLDLRWNNGGNTYLVLPLLHQIIAAEVSGQFEQLYVIIGRRTYSAAMNFASLLDRHTNAIFVGEPTGSRPNFIGETSEFVLPYNPQLTLSISDIFWQSGWPTDSRQYIAPDIDAPPTFAAYQQGIDPALEAILNA